VSDEGRWICVTGRGEATVAPDLAIASFTLSGENKELATARDDVNRRASAVLEWLRRLEIAAGDVSAPDVSIQPQYDYRRGQRLVGYRVARAVTVTVRDLDRLGEVLDGVVAAGANEVHGAHMSASDPSAAEHRALAMAMSAARAKAEALADAAGVGLGGVTRVEEESGVAEPLTPKMAMMREAGAVDVPTAVASGNLTIARRVRAWFELTP
jgi:uncharacterized protein YggE